MTDEDFMRAALQQAHYAYHEDEVPVGCVIVSQQKIIAKAYNQTERLQDPTAHAEMLAITAACEYLGTKYLTDCTLYVTLEPCLMCAGAIRWAQISNICFGAHDLKYGFSRQMNNALIKKQKVLGGVLEEPCRTLLQNFFQEKRK